MQGVLGHSGEVINYDWTTRDGLSNAQLCTNESLHGLTEVVLGHSYAKARN